MHEQLLLADETTVPYLFLSSDPNGRANEGVGKVRPSGFIRCFDPFRSEAEKKLSGTGARGR